MSMPPRTSAAGFAQTLASLRGQWQGLQPAQRRTIAAVAIVALGGIILWASLAARGPAMAPLFTNLAPADGAAIITQLDRSKTPYRLADNGQTILVPRSDVDRLRLQLAGQGLPNQGTVGLGSVLNLPFGATDFTRQVAYQDGLQGELEQTIDQIKGVSSSRVQIVMPQAATFGAQGSPASAAVLVDMQPGLSLTQDQVGGIVHLVASSVQDLSPDDVTVIDQTGQILWSQGQPMASASAGGAAGEAGQAQSDLLVQQQFEQQLQQGLDRLLGQVFGAGNVIAQVNAQLSFSSGTVDKQLFQPAGSSAAVVQSMQELKSTVVGSNTAAGGVPGTSANSQPTTYPASAGGGNTSSTSDQLTQNFDVSEETDHTVVAPGTVSRLTVAVIVNSALTPAQQQLVTSTVQAAVGYDPARQDQITVVGMPFNTALLNQLQKQPAPPAHTPLALPLPVLIGAAAAGALLIVVLALALRRQPAPILPPLDDEPATVADLAAAVADDGIDPLGVALARAQANRDKIQGALRQRPEDVARVVRVWLSQDE
jgi:flagellar M-ring protein FliF